MLKSYLEASHNWKQNWKTPTGSFFNGSFLFSQIVKTDSFFLGHVALSQPALNIELKFTR